MLRALSILIAATLVVTLGSSAGERKDKPTCLVVSRTGNWLKGETYQYQAGEFPPGVKFRVELRNRHLREVYKKGGRIIILAKEYSFQDLQEAKKSCGTDESESGTPEEEKKKPSSSEKG